MCGLNSWREGRKDSERARERWSVIQSGCQSVDQWRVQGCYAERRRMTTVMGGKLAGHLFFAENRENSSKGIAQEAGCQGLS